MYAYACVYTSLGVRASVRVWASYGPGSKLLCAACWGALLPWRCMSQVTHAGIAPAPARCRQTMVRSGIGDVHAAHLRGFAWVWSRGTTSGSG